MFAKHFDNRILLKLVLKRGSNPNAHQDKNTAKSPWPSCFIPNHTRSTIGLIIIDSEKVTSVIVWDLQYVCTTQHTRK